MQSYRHVFFDLDHTLWDFARNSEETLRELHAELQMDALGAGPVDQFLAKYYHHNHFCWSQYRNGLMTKEEVRVERFIYALNDFGYTKKDLAYTLADEYLARSPHKPHLLPHAREILDYLQAKYVLHLITNGFEEVQYTKLKASGLGPYFQQVITSERAGALKPHKQIFEFALAESKAAAHESVYIGDNLEADIVGARNAGWDQVYFNPKAVPHEEEMTHEIRSLEELRTFL